MKNLRKLSIGFDTNKESYLYRILHRPPTDFAKDKGVRGRFGIVNSGQIGELLDYENTSEKRKEAMRKRAMWIEPVVPVDYLQRLFDLAHPDIMKESSYQMPPPTTTYWFVARVLEHYDQQIKQGVEKVVPFEGIR